MGVVVLSGGDRLGAKGKGRPRLHRGRPWAGAGFSRVMPRSRAGTTGSRTLRLRLRLWRGCSRFRCPWRCVPFWWWRGGRGRLRFGAPPGVVRRVLQHALEVVALEILGGGVLGVVHLGAGQDRAGLVEGARGAGGAAQTLGGVVGPGHGPGQALLAGLGAVGEVEDDAFALADVLAGGGGVVQAGFDEVGRDVVAVEVHVFLLEGLGPGAGLPPGGLVAGPG